MPQFSGHPVRRVARWFVSVVALVAVAGWQGSVAASVPPTTTPTVPGAPEPTGDGDQADPNAVTDTGFYQSWTLTPAGGQDGSSVGTRPNLSYQLAPGTEQRDKVVVYNLGNVPLDLRIYATDAFNNDDGDFDLLVGDEVPVDVGSWVKLDTDRVTLDPGFQATIPITINVPADATPGDHVGAIVASSVTTFDNADGPSIDVDRRVGTRLYLQVAGELTPNLALAESDVSASYDLDANPFSGSADVSFRLENRGNVRLGGVPTVEVAGPFGLGSTSIELPEIAELLPGEEVTVTTRLEGVPAMLLMNATVSIEPREFTGVGELSTIAASVRFFAPPVTVLLVVLLGGIVTLLVRSIRRHRRLAAPADGAPDAAAPIEAGTGARMR